MPRFTSPYKSLVLQDDQPQPYAAFTGGEFVTDDKQLVARLRDIAARVDYVAEDTTAPAAPPAGTTVEVPDGPPNPDWTVKQLRAHAETNGLDLGAAKTKTEILAILTPPTTDTPPADGDDVDGQDETGDDQNTAALADLDEDDDLSPDDPEPED